MTRFCGVLGALFLVFGAIQWGLADSDPYRLIPLHLGLGGSLLVGFILCGGREILLSSPVRERLHRGLGTTFSTSLFAVALILVNALAARYPLFSFDTTAEGVHTLAPATEKLLESLPSQLTVRAFYIGGRVDDRKVDVLLRSLSRASHLVSVEVIDPEKTPTLRERYGISEGRTVHLSLDGRPGAVRLVQQIDESAIASALKRLLRSEIRKIYYLTGHGEPDLENGAPGGYGSLREIVEGENLLLVPLVLGEEGTIPADAAALAVSSGRYAFLPRERQLLRHFLAGGGNAIFFAEGRGTGDVTLLVRELGIEVEPTVVLDRRSLSAVEGEIGVEPIVSHFGAHPISRPLKHPVIFSTVAAVHASAEGSKRIVPLAFTSDASWAETDFELLFGQDPRAKLDEGEQQGPLAVAVAWEGNRSRAVVFGDSDFVMNRHLKHSANRDLLLNALLWVLGEEEGIAIRPRVFRAAVEYLSPAALNGLFICTTVLLPEMVLIGGLATWFRRKGWL